jgi:hypothetical protein
MEFKNLGRNILYRLDENLRRADSGESLDANAIYKAFADIPTQNVSDTIGTLHKKGFLRIAPVSRKLSLTTLGKTKVNTLRRRLNVL